MNRGRGLLSLVAICLVAVTTLAMGPARSSAGEGAVCEGTCSGASEVTYSCTTNLASACCTQALDNACSSGTFQGTCAGDQEITCP